MVLRGAEAGVGHRGGRPARVLLLAASPNSMEPLRIDREVRGIEEMLKGSEHGRSVEIITRWAVRAADLLKALVEVQPDVVHFSGHGMDDHTLVLENEDGSPREIDNRALAGLFGVLKERVRVVVLNACYSHAQAKVLAEHVDCAIGMSERMPDDAAIAFGSAFYLAIGSGRSVQTAFGVAVQALRLEALQGADVPVLIARDGVCPSEVVLLPEASVRASARPLGNVPELPPKFLERVDDLERLKALILGGGAKAVGLTGRTIRAGVHGMGGIGKSVLAARLARDEDVRRRFRDGVFWLSLGREPKLTLLQSELCGYLGERGVAFEDEHQGRARVTELLRDRALSCLVILDDVWDARHTAAFGEMAPEGRLLITTRDAGILSSLGALDCSLDVLPADRALELLARWSGKRAEELPKEAEEVAEECGYLPLALAMIGAMVRGRPERWHTALQKLRKPDLEAICQNFPDYPYPNLLRAIEVSLEALDSSERQRYFDFAVFAEDTPVPEAVLWTLWRADGLEDYEAQDLLDCYVDRSLIRRDEEGRLRLHDLQYDYLRTLAEDISALHQRLVDAYVSAYPGGLATAADDGYFFANLAKHLVGAGRADELRRLLLDYGWLHAKLEATDPVALLADYGLTPGGEAERLVEEALRLSAHILAIDKGQLAPQLLGRLLEEGDSGIRALLCAASTSTSGPWLRPYAASLTRPGGALRCTLAGHRDAVNAVAVTPDGRYAVSGSDDGTLKVWELSTGREVRTLAGYLGRVRAVAVTPNGLRAVAGSSDATLTVWELSTGRELRVLVGHLGEVLAVAVTRDGRYAVSASHDKTLRLWELSTGREVRVLAGHSGGVLAVAITPDGRYAVSGSRDKTLRVWDLSTGREMAVLARHLSEVTAVALTQDARYAVSASDDATLRVWELSTGREVDVLTCHEVSVNTLAVTPEGPYAVSGSWHKTLTVWELSSGLEVRALAGHSDVVLAVVVTPDGRYAVSGSADKTLKVWDLSIYGEAMALAGHSSEVTAVAVTHDGEYAVSGSDDTTLKVWDLSTGREVRSLVGHVVRVNAVTVTPDGRYAVSSSWAHTLKVWDLSSGREVRALAGHTDVVFAVAATPDGRCVVSGSGDKTLKVWDLSTGRETRELVGHSGGINTVAVTPDGQYVVSGSRDSTLKVWELSTGLWRRDLTGHSGRVNAVAVTPDGQYAVSGSEDKTLRVWKLSNGGEVRTLAGHSGEVTAVAVTPDGRNVVSASEDQTLKVWDFQTGAPTITLHGDAPFRSVGVAPDGRTVIAGDADGRVHFLQIEGLPYCSPMPIAAASLLRRRP